MPTRYRVCLSQEEQQQLKDTIHQAKIAKHKRIHAQILLCLDENGPKLTEVQTSQACDVSTKTVQRTRKRCVLEGTEVAVNSKFNGVARSSSVVLHVQWCCTLNVGRCAATF